MVSCQWSVVSKATLFSLLPLCAGGGLFFAIKLRISGLPTRRCEFFDPVMGVNVSNEQECVLAEDLRMKNASLRFRARVAGGFYLFSLVTAAAGETLFHGWLNYAVGYIAILGMVAVTLLLFTIFKPVNRSVALLAASINLVGLVFEALRLNPRGVDIALVLAGVSCLLAGYLIFKSTFLPRNLGALMALAGLCWITYLSPPLVNYLSPWNVAVGVLAEASFYLWLLVKGVNEQRWNEQAG